MINELILEGEDNFQVIKSVKIEGKVIVDVLSTQMVVGVHYVMNSVSGFTAITSEQCLTWRYLEMKPGSD